MHHEERTGQLIALAGFATLSLGDAVIKSMAGEWSVIAVSALRFVIGSMVLSSLLFWREGAGGFRPTHPWMQLARGVCMAISAVLFFAAIFVMPLAETMAITFVSPVFTALLSGPLLREKVRQSVFVACAIAFAGVLIVLRPNLAEVGAAALFPIGSAFFFSLTVILNRASVGQGSVLAMQAYIGAVAALVLSLTALAGHFSGVEALAIGWPPLSVIARCALVGISASASHYLIYMGTQRAGASQVAPMSYVQMLMATLLGWLFFGDLPDALTYAGVAVIIAAGLYLWHSGRRQVGTAIG